MEVTGLDVEDTEHGRRIRRVHTDQGTIEAAYVVIACGVWSPKIGDMAGVRIALTPAVHQMISVGPCPQLAEREGEISFPIVRDMDTLCYERQHGADMEVGSYAHRAILHEPEDIPSLDQAKLSPTEMPFTEDDFDPQLEQALELMPELLGADGAEIRYAINGLLSLTADGAPILGESEVTGLWVAAAVWIKEGPGVGRAVAEWMTHGHSRDRHPPQRHVPLPRPRDHPSARQGPHRRGVHQDLRDHPPGRAVRVRPRRPLVADGGVARRSSARSFYETVGWERPWWYESNAGLLEKYGDAVMPREHEWDSRWWSPIINAEHLAMRENAGVIDLTAFCIFDITGPGALASVQQTCVAQCDVAVGKVIYTPVLDAKGGFLSDLTVMRLGDDHFRVVTGGAHGMADRKWFTDHLVDGRRLVDRTEEISTIGLWGPQGARHPRLAHRRRRQRRGLRHAHLPGDRVKGVDSPVLASRISYVGELGWELYVPFAQAAQLWDAVLGAGKDHGAVPVGIGVYGTTGRIEKGYRAFGFELDSERTIIEAGDAAPQGEGGRLRRQGGLPRAAWRAAARRRCCAR